MAPAEEGVALAAAASASGRRRGRRELVSWGTVFCFGSRRERRTVPVDGDLVPGAADRDVMRSGVDGKETTQKRPRLQGCCFLAPARPPGRRKHGTMSSGSGSGSGRSTHDRQQEHTKQPLSPSEAPAPSSQAQATAGSRSRRAEQRPRGAGGTPAETRARTSRPSGSKEQPSKGEACAFGPVVGLSVVAAVSMAGLLGGRLWAVACVCAWLAALSGLRRREAGAAGSGTAGSDDRGEEAAVHADSTDYKKLVVVRRLPRAGSDGGP